MCVSPLREHLVGRDIEGTGHRLYCLTITDARVRPVELATLFTGGSLGPPTQASGHLFRGFGLTLRKTRWLWGHCLSPLDASSRWSLFAPLPGSICLRSYPARRALWMRFEVLSSVSSWGQLRNGEPDTLPHQKPQLVALASSKAPTYCAREYAF